MSGGSEHTAEQDAIGTLVEVAIEYLDGTRGVAFCRPENADGYRLGWEQCLDSVRRAGGSRG